MRYAGRRAKALISNGLKKFKKVIDCNGVV